MTKLTQREYNVYTCPPCKHFLREHRPPRMGWCSARKGAPVPVVASGAEPLMKTMPCTEFLREKRK